MMTTTKRQRPPRATEDLGYVDLWDTANRRRNPLILANGTSILWPNGWKQRDADAWRRQSNLVRPPMPKKKTAASARRRP